MTRQAMLKHYFLYVYCSYFNQTPLPQLYGITWLMCYIGYLVIFQLYFKIQIQTLIMKLQVPPLNAALSVLHLTFAIATLYILKLAINKTRALNNHNNNRPQCKHLHLNWNKTLGVSWLKKYSLVGVWMNQDKKYALKQLMIVSCYAMACLNINKLIIWPLGLIGLLLPTICLLFEVLIDKINTMLFQKESKQSDSRSRSNQNRSQNNLQFNSNTLQANQLMRIIDNNKPKDITIKKDRTQSQVIIVCLLAFIAVVLYLQTVMVISNSISNSAQLNILSIFIIVAIDQFAIRLVSGLTLLAIVNILSHYNFISLQQNALIQSFCSQQIMNRFIQEHKNGVNNKRQQLTGSPLKIQNLANIAKANEQMIQEINIVDNIDLDLFVVENQPEVNVKKHISRRAYEVVKDDVFFTTPERDLFLQAIEQSPIDRVILYDCINFIDKENTNSQNICKSSIKSSHPTDGLEEVITNNHENLQNKIGDIDEFNLYNSPVYRKNVRKGRKQGRRKLTLTGNSPYLEYLPNMLKNIDKYKDHKKETIPVKKML